MAPSPLASTPTLGGSAPPGVGVDTFTTSEPSFPPAPPNDSSELSKKEAEKDPEAAIVTGTTAGESIHATAMYARFTSLQKTRMVAIVSFCSLLPPFASSAFLPSLSQVAKDLSTTVSILNTSISAYLVVLAIAPLIWAPLAGIYGRRIVYLTALLIFTAASVGVAMSPNLGALVATRMVQGVMAQYVSSSSHYASGWRTVQWLNVGLAILVPLSQTIGPRYNISNLAILGCIYLAQGFGNFVAAQFTGRYADFTLRRWLKKRGGVYIPEDRLRASIVGGALFFPGSVIALGWVIEKSSGPAGLAGCVVLLFVNGVALMIVLTPSNTYLIMHSQSAEVIAANNFLRYILSAAASAFVLPMI
ncbi:hypothetical protein MNV49_001309, partial [Pseudohyphozyma bogoriensis]